MKVHHLIIIIIDIVWMSVKSRIEIQLSETVQSNLNFLLGILNIVKNGTKYISLDTRQKRMAENEKRKTIIIMGWDRLPRTC